MDETGPAFSWGRGQCTTPITVINSSESGWLWACCRHLAGRVSCIIFLNPLNSSFEDRELNDQSEPQSLASGLCGLKPRPVRWEWQVLGVMFQKCMVHTTGGRDDTPRERKEPPMHLVNSRLR